MSQVDLFAKRGLVADGPPPAPRKTKQRKTVYQCSCGKRVIVYVNVVHVFCGCGRVMRK